MIVLTNGTKSYRMRPHDPHPESRRLPEQVEAQGQMSLPAWAIPTVGRTVILPAVSDQQERWADDMLTIWGQECRRSMQERQDADKHQGDGIGRMIESGPEGAMAIGKQSHISPVASICDQMVAALPSQQHQAIRHAYAWNTSPREAVLRLFKPRRWIHWDDAKWEVEVRGYYAVVDAGRLRIAARLRKNPLDTE